MNNVNVSESSYVPTIMIVDDNPENLNVLSQALKESGYRIKSAPNGKLALQAAFHEPPDLMLLDIMMPDMDGYEVCRHLKENEANKDTPVIFISALGSEYDEEKGLQTGAVDYITKPVQIPIVLARVNTHIQLKLHQDRLENLVRDKTADLEKSNQELVIEISERKRHEKEIATAHSEMQQLLHAITAVIISVSSKDIVTHWNPTAETLFGLAASDVLNKKFGSLPIKWNWAEIYEGISESIVQNRPVRLDDVRFTRTDGKERFLGLTINPIQDVLNNLTGFIIRGADITEKKILESQVNQTKKMESIGQMAAGIAHEINSPMQYIYDNLYFLRDSLKSFDTLMIKYNDLYGCIAEEKPFKTVFRDLKKMKEKLEDDFILKEMPLAINESLEGVERVVKIVKSMKEFSHPGTGEKTLADINKAIESTVTVSRNEWKYIANVEFDFDDTLPLVPCFLGELNQAILNIIINAAQAIEEHKEKDSALKGTIKIVTKKLGKYAEIRISDTGGGIPAEIQPKIFDPFFTTKEVGKGTGQGLAITFQVVVEKHGGQINFESVDGDGTTFIVQLPIEEK